MDNAVSGWLIKRASLKKKKIKEKKDDKSER
jgi:hypothetical protein